MEYLFVSIGIFSRWFLTHCISIYTSETNIRAFFPATYIALYDNPGHEEFSEK